MIEIGVTLDQILSELERKWQNVFSRLHQLQQAY